MECNTEETEVTKRMLLKEKQTLMKVLGRCKEGSYCVIYGDEIETIRRAIETRGRAMKKAEDLERIIDEDTEPNYWYKERYALDTINHIIGKEKCKKCTKDKEGEER